MTEAGYLLRIKDENGVVVAEAPLLIHDAPVAWRIFSEAFGVMVSKGLLSTIEGSMYNSLRVGCDPALFAKHGPQQGLFLQDDGED